MKTYLNYSQQNNNINNNMLLRKHKAKTEQKNTITRENTELNRPARAISFGGSAVSKVANFGQKAFTNTVEFVYENEAAYNAIYSLLVAGIIKPIAVINMPGSEDKDKQIIATKNFLQAFLGSFLGLTVGGGFVKKAMDIVKNNLKLIDDINPDKTIALVKENSEIAKEVAKEVLEKEKTTFKFKLNAGKEAFSNAQGFKKFGAFYKGFNKAKYEPNSKEITQKIGDLFSNFNKNHRKAFEKNTDFIKEIKAGTSGKSWIKKVDATTYEDAFETFWKNSTGATTAILKAKIASVLLPTVMAFLFAKKNLEKEQAKKARENTLTNNSTFINEQQQFQKMLQKKSSSVPFTGNTLNSAIDGTATLIEKTGMSKGLAWFTKNIVASWKKPAARMADIESILLTGYWIQDTTRSKKIEPSQKLGLNVHTALVTAVSSTAAFIIDWLFDGLIDKSKAKYSKKLTELTQTKDISKIAKECENMIGAKDIVEKLGKIDLGNNEAVESTIKKLTKLYGKKLSKFKSLTIFTLVVRLIVPVAMVPFSGKLKKKIIELTNRNRENEIKNQPKK